VSTTDARRATGGSFDGLSSPLRLAAVGRASSIADDPRTGLSRFTALAVRELGVDVAFLSLVSDSDELVVAVQTRFGGQPSERLPVEQSLCGYVASSGQTLMLPDLALDPRSAGLESVRERGLRAYAGVPIHDAAGSVLGGFCVAHTSPRQWDRHDRLLLADLAAAASTELSLRVTLAEVARLEVRARRRAHQERALHRVAAAVARGEEPGEVLALAARELVGLLGVQGALILRFDGNGRALVVASAGRADEQALDGCLETLARVRGGQPSAVGGPAGERCAVVPVLREDRMWGAVVVLTGAEEPEDPLLHLEELADAVALVVDSAEARRRLAHLAETDPLTGVPNRRTFTARLHEELARAVRHGHPLTLAIVDVDEFKPVNDAWGHERGDRLLQELASRLQVLLRSGDLLARIGGDEFALVLPETGEAAAGETLDRLRRAVSDTSLAGLEVTVTIGGAVTADGAAGASALLRAADRALYEGKRRGRDVAVVVRED
jgi:diguanylate cyclase (GGDEF)-like protein